MQQLAGEQLRFEVEQAMAHYSEEILAYAVALFMRYTVCLIASGSAGPAGARCFRSLGPPRRWPLLAPMCYCSLYPPFMPTGTTVR